MICPNCGEDNPDRARLCMMCGASLKETRAPQAEERKVVSILFVDLVGFTARSHAADPEDVRAALSPYHAMLKREIERFGGTVEKFIGDAVMAVFGAPVTHEDDAERAVRAALRITEAIKELNDQSSNLDLSIRAAVNTGEGLVALGARPEAGEGMVTGDVVNTASRLQGVAPVNGVAVGELTYRATKDLIDYEQMEPVDLKGKPEPVAVWQALSATSRFGVDVDMAPATAFVGREYELATLQTAYQRTLRESSVQLVTVVGEPGVGKSRLLAELGSYIDERQELVFWRQGRCLPYGDGITFWALGEVVKAHAGILESDGSEEAEAKLAAAVEAAEADPSERQWLKARLAPLVGLASVTSAEREESFAAWLRFLEAIAASGPLVLVFEDLHWGDQAMLEFVEHVVEYSSGVPLLVVCTARPELYEKEPSWGGGKRNSTTISLGPLTREETARLVGELLATSVLPAATQELLLERSGGNPLYAEEFVRMLKDKGLLSPRGVVVEDQAGIELPGSVQAVIAARLDTLAPERKALVQDAAVVGKVFWSGALCAMGKRDPTAVREGLHELARKELVRPVKSPSVRGEAEYSFWHALLRDVAYSQIPRAKRAQKHQDAAQWIEQLGGERVADHAEVLAHHLTEALELTSGAGQDTTALHDPARRYLLLAGERALTLDATRAADYYRRALELAPPDGEGRAEILVRLGEAAYGAGSLAEAQEVYDNAIEFLRAGGHRAQLAQAMTELSKVLRFRGDSASCRAAWQEALELLEEEPPGPELAGAYTQAAAHMMTSGDSLRCLEYADKAAAISKEQGLSTLEVRILGFRGVARCDSGDLGGVEDLRRALKRGLGLGLGLEVAVIYNNLADILHSTEGPAAALEIVEEGVEFARTRGFGSWVMIQKAESLSVLYDLGRWDEVMELSAELLDWDEAQGGTQIGPWVAATLGRVLTWRGRVAEASSLLNKHLPGARASESQQAAECLAVAATAEALRGDPKAALSLIEEFATVEAPMTYKCMFLPGVVRSLAAADELSVAIDLIELLRASNMRDENCVMSARARGAEAHSDMVQAVDLYREAEDRWQRFGNVPERAHALLGQGRCLVALGKQRKAASPLGEAREIFLSLDAKPLVAEADLYLQQQQAAGS